MFNAAGRYVRRHHVGLLALLVAMSGTAYAAVQLPKNSIKSRHIANGQVRGPDVREASLGQVPAAGFAQRADTAGFASNAQNAVNAQTAQNAQSAVFSQTASSASTADHANDADHADAADTATSATSAAQAANATQASNADTLDNMDSSAFLPPGHYMVTASGTTNPTASNPGPANNYGSQQVNCNAGDLAVSGGYQNLNGSATSVMRDSAVLTSTNSGLEPFGWLVVWINDASPDPMLVSVLCLDR